MRYLIFIGLKVVELSAIVFPWFIGWFSYRLTGWIILSNPQPYNYFDFWVAGLMYLIFIALAFVVACLIAMAIEANYKKACELESKWFK